MVAPSFLHIREAGGRGKIKGVVMAGKRTFMVKAVWDGESRVFRSESDIQGLHIEAETIEEFEEAMRDVVGELIAANHISARELAHKPISELIPAVLWERPRPDAAPA